MKPDQPRTSLAVGFAGDALPARLEPFRGRAHRDAPAGVPFPYEDAQFEVVLLAPAAVDAKAVREAHRVLRADGRLVFSVPEKNGRQDGFTLPDVYRIVREGFNITEVERPPWWRFARRGRTLSICAQKKSWRAHVNTYRPYV